MLEKRKRKILVPVFNRAHLGRLRYVIEEIKKHPDLELLLMVGLPVVYEHPLLNFVHSEPVRKWKSYLWYLYVFFSNLLGIDRAKKNDFILSNLISLGYNVDSRVSFFYDGGNDVTMTKSVGLGICKISEELKRIKPDIVLINADRFEMMSVAIAASYLRIPIAHNEAGDVSGTLDEGIRHSITKLANLHFTSTDLSRKRVIQMGENPDLVFNVGSPAVDVARRLKLEDCYENKIEGFDINKPFILTLLHPVATADEKYNKKLVNNVIKTIEGVKIPIVVIASNTDANSNIFAIQFINWFYNKKPNNVFLIKHVSPQKFNYLLSKAVCLLGNSSSFIREGAVYGTPAVVVGDRQKNREMDQNVRVVGIEPSEIKNALEMQTKHGKYPQSVLFGKGDSSKKIADILSDIDLNTQKVFFDL